MTDQLTTKARDLLTKEMALGPITSPDVYALKASMRVGAKALLDEIKAVYKPMKDAAFAAHRAVCNSENETAGPVTSFIQAVDRELSTWDLEQERLRREKEEQLRKQLVEQETKERLDEAVELERDGRTEEAEALVSAPVSAPVVVVESTTPKVAGLSKGIPKWKFRITNPAEVPRKYCSPDESKIRAEVNAQKDQTKIPGVEVYPETQYRATRRSWR